jgi:hypothetical protein
MLHALRLPVVDRKPTAQGSAPAKQEAVSRAKYNGV